MRVKEKILRIEGNKLEIVGFNVQFSIKDLCTLRDIAHTANAGDEDAISLLIDFVEQLSDKTVRYGDEDSFSITL